MKRATIWAAVIAGVCVLSAALIQKYAWNPKSGPENIPIAGMVIDHDSRLGVPQASIIVVGRPEQYRTEDNGNFSFAILADKSSVVRLQISKAGYRPLDQTVRLPADSLTLALQRQ
jgi:hypothetical protein